MPHTQHCPTCYLAADVLDLAERRQSFSPRLMQRTTLKQWMPAFEFGRQRDSTEFLRMLLQSCDELDKNEAEKRIIVATIQSAFTTPLWQIFGFREVSTVSCTACGHRIRNPVMSQSLELPPGDVHNITLEKALDLYFDSEVVDDYRCEGQRCGVTGFCNKQLSIDTWPRTLIVSLKLFHRRGANYVKLDRELQFPMTLRYKDSPEYTLKSFIVHTGTATVGHYTAYTRSPDNKWYFHNDSDTPKLVSTRTVQSTNPYCLLYEQEI